MTRERPLSELIICSHEREKMELSYEVTAPPGDRDRNLPPVILLHGMMDSKKTWKYVAPGIARNTGRKVYLVDARNHGQSPWSQEFSFDLLAEDLDHFMERHGLSRAALVGHSMGGRSAMTLALKKAECVERLVVEDMTPQNFSARAGGLVVQMLQLMRNSLEHIPLNADETEAKNAIVRFMRSLLPLDESSARRRIDLDMIPLCMRPDGRFHWQANLDVLEQFLTTDRIRQHLTGVYSGDALFLYGTKSFFKVATDSLIPRLFPHSLRVPFEGATHLIHHEFPDEFQRTVSEFLNGGCTSKY